MGNLTRVEDRLRRYARIGAALALAFVTLSVFYVLQDYGPESAIRRFHRAVQKGDLGDLQRVTEQPIDSKSVGDLYRWVQEMNRYGARYQLLRVERQPRSREVYAALVYVLPNGETYATVWVVEKQREAWRVDAARTMTIIEDGFLGRTH
jgi:HAMP domain-containing protein